MTVEDAKKILSGDITAISSEILQEAAKIILSELGKAEEKISLLEKKVPILQPFKNKKNYFFC